MATRKNATKQSQKAGLNLDFDDVKISKKNKSKAKKQIKKVSARTWLFAILFLIIGIGAGFGTYMFICKNDCFDLIGKDEITLTVDEVYVENGVKIISLGKDISDQVLVETNLSKNEKGEYYSEEIGTYYIKYYVKDLKYGTIFKVEKVRLITFVEASEDINVDGGNQ